MQLTDAIQLIHSADLKTTPATWADLGAGSGLFTTALAKLLAPGSKIDAVDKTKQVIPKNASGQVEINFLKADFIKTPLPFNALDGILMANSLHYVADKPSFLQRLQTCLAEDGSFIIVEYDNIQANPWVPYPVDFTQLKALFATIGFEEARKLGERPSIYRNGNIYACQLKRK